MIRYLVRQVEKSDSVKDAANSGRPVIITYRSFVSKVRDITECDCRYTIRNIVKAVGISLLRLHFILKHIVKYEKCMTDKYRVCFEIMNEYKPLSNWLKCVFESQSKTFLNFVTVDKTLVPFFEPVKTILNKI